jgi:NADH:ubiquinone oxidoreductase subunit 6 (subunit J)
MLQAILLFAAIVCAYRAVTAPRILTSTIYLASVSAMAAVVLYLAGAQQLAVIELSVGAGLVTVLLVYAISVVGDEALDLDSVIPKPIAVGLAGLVVILVGWMGLAIAGKAAGGAFQPLAATLWGQRVLDVWIQMVLIFAGVLGILGLLAEGKVSRTAHGSTQTGRGARVVKVVPATACGCTPPPAETASRKNEVHV